jgi:predicted amidohydrolase
MYVRAPRLSSPGDCSRKARILCRAILVSLFFSMQAASLCEVSGHTPPHTETKVRVAAVGFVPRKWDKETNLRILLELIRQAAKSNPDLIVAPEGILEGYVIDSVRKADEENPGSADKKFLSIAEPLDGKCILALKEAARLHKVHLIVGFAERTPADRVYNSAALFDPKGEIVGIYHKNRTIHEKWRPEFYLRGSERPVFQTDIGRLGIMICYDRHFQDIADDLKKNAAQLILIPSYGSWGEKNDREMQERARQTGLPLLFVHPNQALLVGPSGEILVNKKRQDDIYLHLMTVTLK